MLWMAAVILRRFRGWQALTSRCSSLSLLSLPTEILMSSGPASGLISVSSSSSDEDDEACKIRERIFIVMQ